MSGNDEADETYDPSCLFCRIAAGEIPATRVHEDELVVVIDDISPVAPVHKLVMPRAHIRSAAELEGAQGPAASGQIEINGGAELYLSGTIYAPRSDVYVLGNAIVNSEAECDTSTHIAAIQIISWTWQIGGTGDLCMPYDPNQLYKPRSQGLIQ